MPGNMGRGGKGMAVGVGGDGRRRRGDRGVSEANLEDMMSSRDDIKVRVDRGGTDGDMTVEEG